MDLDTIDFGEIPMEAVWKERLLPEFHKPYMLKLKDFLEEERKRGASTFPPKDQIFSAFHFTPFNEVKVVIMGQDPYHGAGQAHGLAFSVPKGVDIPPSLVNIFKELNSDLNIPIPPHGSLVSWAKQGVLLLNAVLTVNQGEAGSHQGKGWELFTDYVVNLLMQRKDPLVFMLWGKWAESKCAPFLNRTTSHLILKAPHPSPLSAHRGYLGCKHFSQANSFLEKTGRGPIDWRFD